MFVCCLWKSCYRFTSLEDPHYSYKLPPLISSHAFIQSKSIKSTLSLLNCIAVVMVWAPVWPLGNDSPGCQDMVCQWNMELPFLAPGYHWWSDRPNGVRLETTSGQCESAGSPLLKQEQRASGNLQVVVFWLFFFRDTAKALEKLRKGKYLHVILLFRKIVFIKSDILV